MPQVPHNVRKERAAILRKEGEVQLNRFLQNKIGREEEVVVENGRIGRCKDFTEVILPSALEVGTLARVNCIAVEDGRMVGEL